VKFAHFYVNENILLFNNHNIKLTSYALDTARLQGGDIMTFVFSFGDFHLLVGNGMYEKNPP